MPVGGSPLHAARHVGDAGQTRATIMFVVCQYGHLGADRTILNLKREHPPVLELELAAQDRIGVEDRVVRRARWNDQLDFPARDADVDGLVAVSVIVQRTGWIAGGFSDKSFLHIAPFHLAPSTQNVCRRTSAAGAD